MMRAMKVERIFLTGASSGIGEALARRLAGPGVTLGLVARRRELLERLAAELRGREATVHLYVADVADTAAMKEAAGSFLAAAGGVDLVVANAGVGIRSALLQGEVAEPARLMQVNVIGVINTVVPFLPALVAQKSGVVAAISSVAGARAVPGRTAYSASKAAVNAFMDGLRLELKGSGVHAMAICPGFIKTPMTAVIKHKMPFVIDVDRAVDEILHAIDRRPKSWTFPWQMRLLTPVIRNAPDWLVRRLGPPPRTQGTPL
jgi:short-subunit dehydrogenase